jgi:hypothetical protein
LIKLIRKEQFQLLKGCLERTTCSKLLFKDLHRNWDCPKEELELTEAQELRIPLNLSLEGY